MSNGSRAALISRLTPHPMREDLYGELHSRPTQLLDVPLRASHIACLATPEEISESRDHMARLAQGGGMRGVEVNLGGIHHRPGRTEVRSYLYLDEGDRAAIRSLLDAGAEVTGRDLPDTSRVPAKALLA